MAQTQQALVNPFIYMSGMKVNGYDNKSPSSTIPVARSSPILERGAQWDVAILRSVVPLVSVPLGICPMLPGATVNTTPFQVSIVRNGTTTTQSVIWAPEYTQDPVPTNTTTQDTSSRYYYYTTVGTLLNRINVALTACATAAGCTNAPLITFDPSSSRFTINLPASDYGSAITNAFASTLRFNLALANLFPNILSTTVAGDVEQIATPAQMTTTIAGISYIQALQEAPNLSAWDSVLSVQILTDMGIISESSSISNTGSAITGFAQDSLLTDVLLTSGTGGLTGGSRSGELTYIYQGLPRWTNMRADGFNSYSVSFNFLTKLGQSFPIVLPPGTSCSFKLVFRNRQSPRSDVY